MTKGHPLLYQSPVVARALVPRPLRSVLPGLALFSCAEGARADGEAWIWAELRLPVTESTELFPRTTLRVLAESRINGRSNGLDMSILRAGPLFDVTSWMFIGVHGTILADRATDDRFVQEIRAELEPNLYGRWGDFTFNDRNRLELRYRDVETRYRYRNQLRVNYAPEGQWWMPFVWDEILVDLSGLGLNQNRVMAGVGLFTSASTRIELGYILRSREEATRWEHDHIGAVNLFFDGWQR